MLDYIYHVEFNDFEIAILALKRLRSCHYVGNVSMDVINCSVTKYMYVHH